jgi:succinoglycan biosynthesis protein ExoA
MPIRNEEKAIGRTLAAVLNQTYPAHLLEVLIADGRSTDLTRAVIEEVRMRHPNVDVTVIDNPRKIVSTGLNLALRLSNGDVILRVDGHTEIPSNYIHDCVRLLKLTQADNVGGRTRAVGSGLFGEAVALATSSPFGVGGARFRYSDREEWTDTVHPGAWRRDIFDRLGAFDEEMVRNQDDEFNYRLREHGGRILLSPRIECKYSTRSSPKALFRQYFLYGYWKVRVLQKHPRQLRMRHLVPGIFVATLLAFAAVATVWPVVGLTLLGLLSGGYLIINVAASAWTVRRASWLHLGVLPVTYAIVHLSYGAGFLIGAVRFARLWKHRNTVTLDASSSNPPSAPVIHGKRDFG